MWQNFKIMSEKKNLSRKQKKALDKIKTVGSIDFVMLDSKSYSAALKLQGSLQLGHVINIMSQELDRMIAFYEANEKNLPVVTCEDYVLGIKASNQNPS